MTCQSCDSSCKTCSSASRCDTCASGYFEHGNSCVKSCPSGYFGNSDKKCESKSLHCQWVEVDSGHWGDWKTAQTWIGYKTIASKVRIEGKQHGGDDTALNGIEVKIANSQMIQKEITIENGNWGGWGSWKTPKSTSDYYACGAQLRVEGKQGGGDDTGANGLNLEFCQISKDSEQKVSVGDGYWGSWSKMVTRSRKAIMGMQVRYEKPQGGGDDTALNGLRVLFCDARFTDACPKGNNDRKCMYNANPYTS